MAKAKNIDEYISISSEFSQPILTKLRAIIHQADDNIEEAIKWSQACFQNNGLICATAAFKQHVNLTFFKGKHLEDSASLFAKSDNNEMSSLKISNLADIPAEDVLIDYVKQAIQYNLSDKPKKTVKKKDKSELTVPDILLNALANNAQAKAHFEQFSYSKQKEYIDWITSAKTEKTVQKRLTTTIEWVSEGKGKNWKYEKC